MPVVERRITIDAPPGGVWALLADVERQPLWMHDLKSVELEGDEPVGVGTRGVGTVRMFGVSQSDPIEITAFDPPRHFALVHLGRFRGSGEMWLTPLADGSTHVRWREELSPAVDSFALPPPAARLATAVTRLVDPLLHPLFSYVFRSDLRRLKRMLESQGERGSAR